MKDPKQIMRERIAKLEEANKTLQSNDINTILNYIGKQSDQLDRVGQYAQEVNGCNPVFLDQGTEGRHGMAHGTDGWIIAGIIQRLERENKELTGNAKADGEVLQKLRKEFDAYMEKHPAVKVVKNQEGQ